VHIKNIGHLIQTSTPASRNKDDIFCPCCRKGVKGTEFRKHIQLCHKFHKDGTALKFPEPGETMKFNKETRKMFKRRKVAHLDFEALLKKISKKLSSNNELVAEHIPNSACILLHDSVDPSKSELWYSVSENIVVEAFKELMAMQKRMQSEVWENQKMQMTQEDWSRFSNADTCYMCHEVIFLKEEQRW
jgi:hypothetical protein